MIYVVFGGKKKEMKNNFYHLAIDLVYPYGYRQKIKICMSENKLYLERIKHQLEIEIPKFYDDYINYVKSSYPNTYNIKDLSNLSKKYKFISIFNIDYNICSFLHCELRDNKEIKRRGIAYHLYEQKMNIYIYQSRYKYIDENFVSNHVEFFI